MYYRLPVTAGNTELMFETWGGTGNCDLYVKRGAVPTTTSYDYRSDLSGNSENVRVLSPASGTWYVMLPAGPPTRVSASWPIVHGLPRQRRGGWGP